MPFVANLQDFKEIPGCNGKYLLSRNGEVWSNETNRLLSPGDNGSGHISIGLNYESGRKHKSIDVLLREVFGEKPDGMREIPNTNGMYLITEDGDIYSKHTHRKLKPCKPYSGKYYTLSFPDKSRKRVNGIILAKRIFKDKLPFMVPIKGTGGMYEITPNGQVYSHKLERFLSPWQGGTAPYYQIYITDDTGAVRARLVHRLVAETFLPNPMGLPQIDHLNGDKLDNRVENLEWVTALENTRRAFRKMKERKQKQCLS